MQIRRGERLIVALHDGQHAGPRCAGYVLGRVVGPSLRHLQRPLLDGQRQHQHGGQFLVRRCPDLGAAPGDELVGDGVQGAALRVLPGDRVAPSEQHRAAIAHRRLERRAGHHQGIEGRYGQAGRRSGGQPPQPARAGRAVREHAVAVAHYGGGQHHRMGVVGDDCEVPYVDGVEQAVQRGPIAAGLTGQPSDRCPAHKASMPDPCPSRAPRAAQRITGLRGPDGMEGGQPVAQGRSLSGLRIAQMSVIRSPATLNAYTVTVMPSSWATRPGWPLTVRSRIVRPGAPRAISM